VGLHSHSHCTTPCYITSVNGAVCVNPFNNCAAARRIFAAFSPLRPEFTLRVVHVQFVNIMVLVMIYDVIYLTAIQNEKLFHSATNIAGSEMPVTYAMYNEYQ